MHFIVSFDNIKWCVKKVVVKNILRKREITVVRGRVKWFNNEKGYGFIEYPDKEDIFVHYSAINQNGYKTLMEGQCVEFTLLDTSKGYQATNVSVVNDEIIM